MNSRSHYFTLQSGTLLNATKELTGLVRQVLRREAKGQSDDKIQLEQEVHRVMETMDKLNIELSDVKEKLKLKVIRFKREFKL